MFSVKLNINCLFITYEPSYSQVVVGTDTRLNVDTRYIRYTRYFSLVSVVVGAMFDNSCK